ncbi:MAG: hypothetical protein ACXWC7_17535, partial [Chitinophagaceae bacterium]
MPDFDFDAFNHDENPDEYIQQESNGEVVNGEAVDGEVVVVAEKREEVEITPVAEIQEETGNIKSGSQEEVDKW